MIIGLNSAERFIRIIWNLSNIDGEHPIGVLLVAPPGVGKSYLLTSFKGENFIILSDLTGHGLEKILAELQAKARGYVVLPDLIRAFTRHTTQALFAVLNMCLEEGITRIERADIRFQSETPIRFGFIGAITPTELKKREKDMISVGLLSRLLLFSFGYTKEDAMRIIDYVAKNGMPKPEMKIPLEIHKPVPVSIPDEITPFVKKIGTLLAKLKQDRYPFRSIKLVRRLLKGSALCHKRKVVNIDDCITIYSLLPFLIDTGTDLDFRLLFKIANRSLANKPTSRKELIEKASMYSKETVTERLNFLESKRLITQDENGLYHINLLEDIETHNGGTNYENNKLYQFD